MTTKTLTDPISAVIFDCDGTLSSIEGIDELARYTGVYDQVSQLTASAMGNKGLTLDLYRERLNLVKPSKQHLLDLAQQYFKHKTLGVIEVINALQKHHKEVYIVSAGLSLAVNLFGQLLGVAPQNIFAVDVYFDESGSYLDFDRDSPLVHNDGKRKIITEIKSMHPRVAFIGDGSNDFAAHDMVTRFIGFGGHYYRKNMADLCEFYIKETHLSNLLSLLLTATESSA